MDFKSAIGSLPVPPTFTARNSATYFVMLCLSRDCDLQLPGGPATLETASAFSGVVVQHDMQHIVARSVECGEGCGFAREGDSRCSTRQFFHCGPRVGERDDTGAAKHRPMHGYGESQILWGGARRRREFRVILNPHRQVQWAADFRSALDNQ